MSVHKLLTTTVEGHMKSSCTNYLAIVKITTGFNTGE